MANGPCRIARPAPVFRYSPCLPWEPQQRNRRIAVDRFECREAAHRVPRDIDASGIQRWIGFQQVSHKSWQNVALDAFNVFAALLRPENVLMFRRYNGKTFGTGKSKQADLVDEGAWVVAASMHCENQRYCSGRRSAVKHFVGEIFEPGLQVFAGIA